MNIDDVDKYKKIFMVGLFVLSFIFVVVFLVTLLNPGSNNPSNITSTPTLTTTSVIPTLPIISFSGFTSNVNLSFSFFTNYPKTLNTHTLNAFSVTPVDKAYLVNKLKMSLSGGSLQNDTYVLVETNDSILLSSKKKSVSGNISQSQVSKVFTDFYTNTLGLNSQYINTTISKDSNYHIKGYLKVNAIDVVNLNNNPSIAMDVSSGGSIINVYIYNVFTGDPKSLGSYSLILKPSNVVVDNKNLGLFVNLGQSQGNNPFIFAESVNIEGYTLNYYYDVQTGSIIPILSLNTKFYSTSKGVNYTAKMFSPLIDSDHINFIPKVTPQINIGHG